MDRMRTGLEMPEKEQVVHYDSLEGKEGTELRPEAGPRLGL